MLSLATCGTTPSDKLAKLYVNEMVLRQLVMYFISKRVCSGSWVLKFA